MSYTVLDFETYFDNDYSLRKLTTENYVRDFRFEALCMGYKKDNELSLLPRENNLKFSSQTISLIIKQKPVVCHHAHFDGLILSHHFNVKPVFWFDTLSMARCAFPHDKSHSLEALAEKFGIGHKTVPYEDFKGKHWVDMGGDLRRTLLIGCMNDVELTDKIFRKLLPLVPKEELKVIDMTIRMFTEPTLLLDRPRVVKYISSLTQKQDELLSSLGVTKKDLASADKFAALLESYGIEPPTKISPRTGKTTYAFARTDQGFLDLLEGQDERLSLLCEARLSTKSTIGETRAGRLLSMSTRGKLPVYLKYFGAHTGRWSGGDKLNFQNFPRGGELRTSLCAPDGHVLCVIDLSQIECRMLAYLARETWVLDAFRQGRDLYCEMATDVYGRTITKADKAERFLGKTLVLGAGYGVGWAKLQKILKLGKVELTDSEAKRAIDTYRAKHPNIVKLWSEADYILARMAREDTSYVWGPMIVHGKKIVLPNGVSLDYSNLNYNPQEKGFVLNNPKGTTKIYGGKLVENVVQALSRVVMSQAMLKIGAIYKLVTTTHDEIVFLAPEDEAEMAMEIGFGIMKQSPPWAKNLPLNAEGGYDVRYSK